MEEEIINFIRNVLAHAIAYFFNIVSISLNIYTLYRLNRAFYEIRLLRKKNVEFKGFATGASMQQNTAIDLFILGNLKDAIEKKLILCNDAEKRNMLLLHLSKVNELEDQKNKGTLSVENYQTEINKVKVAFLEFLN